MRERRTHGSVRGLRREPLVYSTDILENRDLQMNFLNFPCFSRLFKPHTVNCYVFSLVFALMGSLQGKVFLNVSNRCPPHYPRALRKSALLLL